MPSFTARPFAVRALALERPAGPVADLACAPSGAAVLAAAAGREVTAADIPELAAGAVAAGGLLGGEALAAEARRTQSRQ